MHEAANWQRRSAIGPSVAAISGSSIGRSRRRPTEPCWGKNLSSKCLVARFLASEGEIDELLEIEG